MASGMKEVDSMLDRLCDYLNDVAKETDNETVKIIIQTIIDMGNELAYMDWSDYEDYIDTGGYERDSIADARYLERLVSK